VLQQQRRYFGRANLYLTSKQKSDTKRAGAFTKLCNEIWSAAKDGGTDPDGNHRLALAISKAKDANVPKANIERALARATETADAMEEVTYELYAPGGVGLIVAANTDSPNRTIRALKGVVKDYSGASMAAPGAVAWQFERTGLLRIAEGTERDMDKLMELAIDNGATDVDEEQVETDGRLELTVLCEPAELGRLCNEVRAAGFSVTQVMRPYLPTSTVDVQRTSDDYESLISFLDEIDAIEDVTDVFSNCRFS
jgi:YebC/PmpR family DNA-binding regulatory protein